MADSGMDCDLPFKPTGLARRPPDDASDETALMEWPQFAQPHVLLVEDDHAVRDATRMLLKVNGYRVTAVSSLSEALQRTSDIADLDLLVTAYRLGCGATGMQVITALRASRGVLLKAVLIAEDTSSRIQELFCCPYLRLASQPARADELLGLLRALLTA
jgi:CheY-like chemotaxis protein